jgi:hypothetical protein
MLQIDQGSLAHLLLTEWLKPLIPIIVGGAFASILFPRWQSMYNQTKTRTERRVSIIEDMSVHFSKYVTAWRRLLQITRLEEQRPLSEAELQRKEAFVEQRTEERDELFSSFARGQLYFTEDACALIGDFMRWDQAQSSKTIADLPDIEEWRAWERRIFSLLKQHEVRYGSWR